MTKETPISIDTIWNHMAGAASGTGVAGSSVYHPTFYQVISPYHILLLYRFHALQLSGDLFEGSEHMRQ